MKSSSIIFTILSLASAAPTNTKCFTQEQMANWCKAPLVITKQESLVSTKVSTAQVCNFIFQEAYKEASEYFCPTPKAVRTPQELAKALQDDYCYHCGGTDYITSVAQGEDYSRQETARSS